MEHLEGIAEADALLGRPFPLPRAALPLARWVEVCVAPAGAEVEWNLDDTRPGTPGRLALYAGHEAQSSQLPPDAELLDAGEGLSARRAPLDEAQESLRPVVEVAWCHEGLHLRLTAQGPWELDEVLGLARSVG